MDTNNPPKLNRDDPIWGVAQAVAIAVLAIRKARGKKNPADCVFGSPEHLLVVNDFLSDVLTSLAEPEDEADGFGAGAAG
jgi:hypothetical protein